MDSERSGASMIDFELARATACRLVSPGPAAGAGETRAVVADLRRYAAESREHVARFTGLDSPGEPAVLVVDRPGWLDVNIEAFAHILDPLLAKMGAERSGPAGALVTGVGSRVTGIELGALLAYIGSRVLGQYEPFLATRGAGAAAGRGTLLLVAPNIVAVERELGVDAADFRRWVCLHEETHRTQFTAVPWLREHVAAEVGEFLTATEVDPGAVARRLRAATSGLADAVRGRSGVGLLDLVQSPEQRAILDRLTAVMSLLEGHAEYVMDGVGPEVIPTVAEIRRAFAARRAAPSGLDALVRRLIGFEAKMRQYRDGERFVRAVVEQVGMAGFNRVWDAPAELPTLAEVHDPAAWVNRVHGPRAVGAI